MSNYKHNIELIMSNYKHNIESLKSHPYGFINIFHSQSGKKISLKNIEKSNYKIIINYVLQEYFNFEQIQDVKIMTSNGEKNINNISLNDLHDSIGSIIYVVLNKKLSEN